MICAESPSLEEPGGGRSPDDLGPLKPTCLTALASSPACSAAAARRGRRGPSARGKGEELDPLKLPTRLQTALQAFYGHYEKTFKLWEEKGIKVPPCFIIVCQTMK
jgi:hypothetical protein